MVGLAQVGIILSTLRGIAKPLPRHVHPRREYRIPRMLQSIGMQPPLQQAMVGFDDVLRCVIADTQDAVGICLWKQQDFTNIELSGFTHPGLRFTEASGRDRQ
jgi:hypothetical protein